MVYLIELRTWTIVLIEKVEKTPKLDQPRTGHRIQTSAKIAESSVIRPKRDKLLRKPKKIERKTIHMSQENSPWIWWETKGDEYRWGNRVRSRITRYQSQVLVQLWSNKLNSKINLCIIFITHIGPEILFPHQNSTLIQRAFQKNSRKIEEYISQTACLVDNIFDCWSPGLLALPDDCDGIMHDLLRCQQTNVQMTVLRPLKTRG